jgi:hypothetical protein
LVVFNMLSSYIYMCVCVCVYIYIYICSIFIIFNTLHIITSGKGLGIKMLT